MAYLAVAVRCFVGAWSPFAACFHKGFLSCLRPTVCPAICTTTRSNHAHDGRNLPQDFETSPDGGAELDLVRVDAVSGRIRHHFREPTAAVLSHPQPWV
jgi:hypothetical protein